MKKNTLILSLVLSIIAISSLATFAWFTWSSSSEGDTELTLTIGNVADVKFETGNDINVDNIGPVLNYNDGESTTFTIKNKSESTIVFNIGLNITNIPDELKEESFKYVLLSSTDNKVFKEVISGTFKDASVRYMSIGGGIEVAKGDTYFKFIIYIDGHMENPIDMMGKRFSGELQVDAGEVEKATDKIISLSQGDTWESGASGVFATNSYVDETVASYSVDNSANNSVGEVKYHEYRYIGANVNNYVSFNNDLYRIIGVFDDNSHGVEGEYLIKLIRANPIGSYSWGIYNTSNTSGVYSNYSNDWTGGTTGVKANLNVLLNEYFYNKTDTSSTYGSCSTWTYYYNNTGYRTNDCTDIVGYGISSEYRDYIEDVTWYLYGSNTVLSKQNFYLCERGQYDGCIGGNNGTNDTSTNAKIGLMYPSDYMYASGYFESADSTTGSSKSLVNQNWLYNGLEYLLNVRNDSQNAVLVTYMGSIASHAASKPYSAYVRPTFYLKSSVNIVGGNGTFENPYAITM